MSGSIESLRAALRKFAAERDWEQFHSPKNLACAISVEVAEVLEHFQWLTNEESRVLSDSKLAAVREELADVLLYLIQLADRLDIDLVEAGEEKLKANAQRYPADKAAGSSRKYTEL